MLADLVGDGLAAARRETVMVHKREITVVRVCIAEAGQKSIKSWLNVDRRRSAISTDERPGNTPL